MKSKGIVIFSTPSCTSCRKVKKWFKKSNIDFLDKNIIVKGINKEEIKKIIHCSKGGFNDIISERNKSLKKLNIDINNLTTSEMIDLIHNNPEILRRPIILQEESERLLVGYNSTQIELFSKED